MRVHTVNKDAVVVSGVVQKNIEAEVIVGRDFRRYRPKNLILFLLVVVLFLFGVSLCLYTFQDEYSTKHSADEKTLLRHYE